MQQYSFLSMVVLLNGVPLTGWAEGDDVIQAQRTVDTFTHQTGADGRMLVAENADKSGSFTFRLQQQSEGNLLMNSLLLQQQIVPGAFVPVRVDAMNLATGEKAMGSSGYVTKPANVSRGTNPNAQEWVVNVERLDMVFGNPTPSIALV